MLVMETPWRGKRDFKKKTGQIGKISFFERE
jgi:hypothetical protein